MSLFVLACRLLHTLTLLNAYLCELYSVFIVVRMEFCKINFVFLINSYFNFGRQGKAVGEV